MHTAEEIKGAPPSCQQQQIESLRTASIESPEPGQDGIEFLILILNALIQN
jgi:hypothetical protein